MGNAVRDPDELLIRPIEVADAGEILTVQRAAFVSEAQIYGDPAQPALIQTLEQLQSELRSANGFVAVLSDRVIGAIRAVDRGELLQIGRLAIAPDHQGEGVGRALLRAIE